VKPADLWRLSCGVLVLLLKPFQSFDKLWVEEGMFAFVKFDADFSHAVFLEAFLHLFSFGRGCDFISSTCSPKDADFFVIRFADTIFLSR
jgi:hypothetical protein